MITRLMIAGAALSLSSPVLAQDKVFDFMGFNTETSQPVAEVAGKKCEHEGAETHCTLPWNVKLGDAVVSVMMINFYQDKLASVLGIAERKEFLDLLSVFSAKYGEPTMTTEKWQNRAGATFDNSVAVWNFKDGKLKLKEIGSRVDNSDFEFFSTVNQKPSEKPNVNF